MVARISTDQFYHTGLNTMETHAQKLLELQEQLSSGKRVTRPSDDPVAMSKIHNLNKSIDTLDQFVENGRYARAQLTLEDTVLDDSVSTLQRARELALQMMNDTYNAADRAAAAEEVDQLIQHLAGLVNTRNPEKELLFAGNAVNAPEAFADASYTDSGGDAVTGMYAYAGDDSGNRFVQITFDRDHRLAANDQGDPSRVRIGDRGDQVFQADPAAGSGTTLTLTRPDGDTVTVDNNVLNVLVNLRDWLKSGQQPPAEIGEQIYNAIGQITQAQAALGGRINRIDTQYEAHQSFQVALKEHRMNLEEVDIVKATADFTQTQVALQFAQQAFAKVQQMSLFNYLR